MKPSEKNSSSNSQEKDKAPGKKKNWMTIFIVVLVSIMILGILYLILQLFNLVFPWFVSVLIMLGLFLYSLRLLIRIMLFPGSMKMMQRSSEYNFMITRAKIMHTKIQHLHGVVECLDAQNVFLLMDYSQSELLSIYERISTMTKSYEKLEEKKIMSSYQRAFYEKLQYLQECCKKTIISCENKTFTFWDLIYNGEHLSNIKNHGFIAHFQSKSQVEDLKSALMDTMDKLDEIVSNDNLSVKQKWNKWFKNDTFGSLTYFKAELQTAYTTKEITVMTKDNTKIDCLMIYGYKAQEENQADTQKQPEDFTFLEGTPTIIFSNPNAGYYEFAKYSNEWVDFYWRKGINVLIWNYRGYGNSEGTPSPHDIFSDAERIVDYLRENEKISLLGAHGQSLGGMVACHIAANKNLDFLCADRTFSCVSDIAYYSMPQCFKQVVRLLTTYDVWSPSNFSKAHCYKVLAYDPKDNIIIYMSSLKNGVSKQIAQNLFLKNNQQKLFHQDMNESMIRNMKGFCFKTWNQDTTVAQVTNIWLKESDQRTLYGAFQRITKTIRFIIEKRDIVSDSNGTAAATNKPKGGRNIQTPCKARTNFMQKQSQSDLNSTLDYSNIINGSFLIDNIKDEDSKSSLQIGNQNNSLHISNSDNNYCSSNYMQKDINEFQDLESQNKNIPASPKNANDISLTQQQPIKKQMMSDEVNNSGYLQLLTDEHRKSKEFSKLMKSIFTILDSFDAGGLSLLDVFYLYSPKYSFQIFQLFILNLNIWGSYLPLNQVIRKNMTGNLPKKYALAKIKEMMRKFENLIKNNFEIQEVSEEIQTSIIGDIRIIINKFKILKDKLQNSQINQSTDKLFELMNLNKEMQILNEGDSKSQDPCSNPHSINSGLNTPKKVNRDAEGELKVYSNLKEESQPSQFIEQADMNKIIGNLLPLSCGHNGFYSSFEVQLFEFHLRNSGFIKS